MISVTLLFNVLSLMSPTDRGGEYWLSLGGGHSARHETSSNSFSGAGQLTVFIGKDVVDDGTPLSLQTFLQQPDTFSVGFLGNGVWATIPSANPASPSAKYSGGQAGLDMSFGTWLDTRFFIGGSLAYQHAYGTYASQGDSTRLDRVAPQLELGVRLGNLHVQGSGRFSQYFDHINDSERRAWALGTGLTYLFGTAVRVSANVSSLEQSGGAVGGSVDVYPTKSLTLSGAAAYKKGAIYVDSANEYRNQGYRIDVGMWLKPTLELVLSGLLSKTTPDVETVWTTRMDGIISFRSCF